MMKSKVRQSDRNGCFLYLFFGLFALLGTVFFVFVTVLPVYQVLRSQGWIETPCRINSSEVEEISGDDGYTYRVAITYSYQVGDETYEGDRYNFSFGSSSGYEGKARVVAEYPPDLETLCYVDPADPSASVINNGPGWFLLWGLFPLPFMAIGYGGLLWFLFAGRSKRSESKSAGRPVRAVSQKVSSQSQSQSQMSAGGQSITETSSPWVGVALIALFAVIWNGIIAIPVFTEVIPGIQAGDPPWIMTIFMVPFVLVGLGLILGVFYMILAVFNPRFQADLDDAYLTTGETCSVRWKFDGRIDRIRKLTITFEGREAATYRRGTSTHTDHHTFYSEQLLATEHGASMSRGYLELRVPESTMPSFESNNNKIEWFVVVHGDIPYWPDVNEELPVVIHPAGDES